MNLRKASIIPMLFMINFVLAQNGNLSIQSISPLGHTWNDCNGNGYNHHPSTDHYLGGLCQYSPGKLITIPYWFKCNNASAESNYWIRVWNNSNGSNANGGQESEPTLCCDHDDFGDCFANDPVIPNNPNVVPVTLSSEFGTYLQLDLFSQCTSCTGTLNTGAWWSSKGSVANPPPGTLNQGFFEAETIREYLESQMIFMFYTQKEPIRCVPLSFVGSPDCVCDGAEYGCGDNDNN